LVQALTLAPKPRRTNEWVVIGNVFCCVCCGRVDLRIIDEILERKADDHVDRKQSFIPIRLSNKVLPRS